MDEDYITQDSDLLEGLDTEQYPLTIESGDVNSIADTDNEVEYRDFALMSDGNISSSKVSGLNACIQWARIALSIARFRYEMFGDDYGSEIDTLLGYSFDQGYIEAECQRMIEECLTQNKYIKGIDEFTSTFSGSHLTCSFKMLTDFGEGEMNNVEI